MDEEYDVIILGTGLTECILSGLLSVDGRKVLQIDRNQFYGSESASLNLTDAYKKFKNVDKPPAGMGRSTVWAFDLVPKFIMVNGELTNMLVVWGLSYLPDPVDLTVAQTKHTDVTRYVEFKQVAGSYVYRDGKIAKVPSNEIEAVRSSLMGLFEKRRMKKFMEFINKWKDDDPSTHQGFNMDRDSMETLYTKFGLEPGTRDFIGHAMALYLDDKYIQLPARETYERILLYASSMTRYGKSPYIYPLYGLGELPQGFARLSAIYGGTYMLDKPVDEIVYDESGKAVGVRSGGEVVKGKKFVGDPTYFPTKVHKVGSVVRAICILSQTIPNTDNSDSVQIVIPQNQVNRKHDIYVAMVSAAHNIAPKDYYIAIVSTIVETANPQHEIEPGLKLLGPIVDQFVNVTDLYEPLESGKNDNCFISKSYDATSHFETTTDDVKDLYRRIEGHELVLKKRPTAEEEQEAWMAL